MTDIKKVTISVTRNAPTRNASDPVSRYEALAGVLGIDAEQAETEWNWTSGSSEPTTDPAIRRTTDNFVKDTRTNRERLEYVISKTFPGALLVFYTDDENMAAVEDSHGNMNRVWPNGEWEVYPRD